MLMSLLISVAIVKGAQDTCWFAIIAISALFAECSLLLSTVHLPGTEPSRTQPYWHALMKRGGGGVRSSPHNKIKLIHGHCIRVLGRQAAHRIP